MRFLRPLLELTRIVHQIYMDIGNEFQVNNIAENIQIYQKTYSTYKTHKHSVYFTYNHQPHERSGP